MGWGWPAAIASLYSELCQSTAPFPWSSDVAMKVENTTVEGQFTGWVTQLTIKREVEEYSNQGVGAKEGIVLDEVPQ